MKGHKLIAVGLGALLLSGFFAGLAIAENDSLYVTMTVEDRHYAVGDTITVHVEVFDAGEPFDIPGNNLTLGVSQNPQFENAIMLNATTEATGVYTASYTVKASNHHNLYFFYEVWSGTDNEIISNGNDALEIHIYSIQDTVEVTVEGQKMVNARPGDVVTARILVRTGDTPIPITGFDELYVTDNDGRTQNLTYRIEDTGIYLADYIIPDVVSSTMFEIYANPADIGDHDSALVVTNVLDVWYHRITAGATTSFELWVAGMDGVPVEGASFIIERDGWPNDVYTGTTDAEGKSLVHVTDVHGTVGFSGYVQANGLNQSIEGAIINQEPEDPHHSEFDIVWEGTQTIFEAGDDITIPYAAYDATVPAGSKAIYYYVEAVGTDFAMFSDGDENHVDCTREVIATGSATTTDLGKFEIEFEAPDTQCALEITFEVPLDREDLAGEGEGYDINDGMYYESWPQNDWNNHGFVFYAYEGRLDQSGDVSIGGGRFKPGSAGTVTVSMEPEVGNEVMAFWGIGDSDMENYDSYDPEWMSWVPAGNNIMLLENEKQKLEGSFHVPEFIEDQDVTVVVGFVDSDGIPHFDSKTISPGGLGSTMWLIIIVIIAIVVAIAIAFVKYQYF